MASSAGALGGGNWQLRAPFGSVALSQSRLDSSLSIDGESDDGARLYKAGLDLRELEQDYGEEAELSSIGRPTLLESQADAAHVSAAFRGGVVSASDSTCNPSERKCDVPRWVDDGGAQVTVWSGAVRGVAALTVVEELGPDDTSRATAGFPPMVLPA
jgi:hypothetical protein